MRGPSRESLSRGRLASLPLLTVAIAAIGCGGADRVEVPDRPGATKSAAAVRAERRAYDGAPPVIAHDDFDTLCTECHDLEGMVVPDVGFAPPSPHEATQGMSAISRCAQCHVFALAEGQFVANSFRGLRQDLRRGARLNPLAPPTLPHKSFMRENCTACHAGPAAREELRTDHPERVRCSQCHVPVTTRAGFEPPLVQQAAEPTS